MLFDLDSFFCVGFSLSHLLQAEMGESFEEVSVGGPTKSIFPRAELLLGRILQAKGDNVAAAEHLRNYLKLAPTSSEVKSVNEFLTKVEQENASAKATPKA